MTRHSLPPLTPLLDHIVILVPHSFLISVPAWLTDHFTIITGGRHADGLTENKLVIFSDGVYLELIAFVDGIDPSKRREHAWGTKPEGTIIDWAYTLELESEFPTIQKNVVSSNSGIQYVDPVPGGRIRPDGVELAWAVSFTLPLSGEQEYAAIERGGVPFWCFDRTPRGLRVPHEAAGNTTHPCGAVGVAGLTLTAIDQDAFATSQKILAAIHSNAGAEEDTGPSWDVGSPVLSHERKARVSLVLASATQEDESQAKPAIALSIFASKGKSADTSLRVIRGKLGDSWLEFKIEWMD